MAHFLPSWIVDRRATKYAMRDHGGFVKYPKSQCVYLGNGTREEVLGVETYYLKMGLVAHTFYMAFYMLEEFEELIIYLL